MGLTKNTDSNIAYLEVKHYSLWRSLKKPVEGCDSVEVTNPKTKAVVVKHGYAFRELSGYVVKLFKYDTEQKYATRYFGFKMQIVDGSEVFFLDMPYQSQILRRFLRCAPNFDWSLPLSITVFKGKKDDKSSGAEPTGIWFKQNDETVKQFYTREEPHGCPPAVQDPETHEWDFKAQHRWLVEQLKAVTIPLIEAIAAHRAPPIEPEGAEQQQPNGDEGPPFDGIEDDDVPF